MRARTVQGTRFRLFPEYASGYADPEVVVLSPPAGSLGAGPSDAAMYAVNPLRKDRQYDPPDSMPPYRDAVHPPAQPGPGGHFDHYPIEAPQFLATHLYGCARRTLDVWEAYLGRRVRWWHADFLPRIELVTVVHWANAHSGPGFIETGLMANRTGREQLFALNFDVIGHETGHAILFSEVGVPAPQDVSSEYLAFHESFSDLIGLIAVLHFPSVIDRLLRQTDGNLYVLNLVNRLGKLSDREQVRIASNTAVMGDVAGLALRPDGSWTDPRGENRNQHALGEPLTGAIFDVLVEIFQDVLVSRGLIRPDGDARGWTRAEVEASLAAVHGASARAYARFSVGFHQAVMIARDAVGRAMAHAILTLRPETLSFPRVAARMLEAAAELGFGALLPVLLDHFLWRGIDPRPFLAIAVVPAGRGRRRHGRRVLRARDPGPGCACTDPAAFVLAGRMIRHPHRMAEALAMPP